MKHITRWLCLVLAVLTCLSVAACGNSTDDDKVTTTTSGNAQVTDPDVTTTENPYDENGYLKSSLPDLDFGKDTFTVAYWSDVEMPEYEAETQNGTVINDAIYQRNLNIEEKLNISIAFAPSKGNLGNRESFSNFIGNEFKAGGKAFDLISAYSRTTALCAINGYCAELSELPYLDWEKPWWPDSLLDVVSIGGKTYFASGDASINVLHFMYGVYYNKDLISDRKLEDPVELVRSGKWTIEKLQEMCKDVYQDLDNDGKKSEGDFYGFATINYGLDAFYTGSGLRLVEQDADKLMILSPSFSSEKAVNLCSTLGKWFETQDAYMGGSMAAFEGTFVAGNCIFVQDRCYLADRKLQDVSFSYGILPTPKYDEEQDDYITVVGNPFSLYAIYGNSHDIEKAAAVLECWASEAYRTTTPAQFEVNMKLKYSESSVEAEMYDHLRSTVCFDLGRLFNNQLSDITDIFFKAAANNNSWATAVKARQKILEKQVSNLAAKFAEQQK